MSQFYSKMTRDQMQSEALIIESMHNAVMALWSAADPADDAYTLVERAHARARNLNAALDSVNDKEAAS